MDKGKRPIEEEEEIFLPLDEDDYDPNAILSLTSPPDLNILYEGIGSGKETSSVDEMEAANEDFFSKFLNMDFVDQPWPNMNEQYSRLPRSKASESPIADANSKPPMPSVPPKIINLRPMAPPPLPPLPIPKANDNPIAFRKTMPPHELAAIAIYDPKRAKRIMANRMSAIRAKEKQKLYMYMLQHTLQTLQSKSTKLSARLTILQTESSSLNSENNMLKRQMGIMTQQLHWQNSLNDQIRSEIQHMRNILAQIAPNYEKIIGFPGINNHASHAPVAASALQLQQLRLQNPYQHQQVQRDFWQQQVRGNLQQHRYLGLRNFRGEYVRGECSQHQQQPQQQQNPRPYAHYQVQHEEERPLDLELMHAEDDSVDKFESSPSAKQK